MADDDVPEVAAAEDEIDGDVTESIVPVIAYDISTYGSDPDVETLVKRLAVGILSVPGFQRGYVWKIDEASRLIESLLLGLPIPSIFLAKEKEQNKFLVIDGQQRLKTLQFYIEGFFGPTGKPFKLVGVQSKFLDKAFRDLTSDDQEKLNQSIIHCINIKQNTPKDDDTSIYHIFERLNSGGRKLTEQEIRIAVYHGKLLETVAALNDNKKWRALFGVENSRKKDQEAILRYIAFRCVQVKYERPLAEYLNKFCGLNRNSSEPLGIDVTTEFEAIIALVLDKVGKKAFKPISNFNVAMFESVMVAIASNFERTSRKDASTVQGIFADLIADKDFIHATTRATADEKSVETRFRIANAVFSK